MTFILNVLHKDFSLLCSDRRAHSEGPSTMRMGNITIHAQGGITINGVRKLSLSADKVIAHGFAGNASDHAYREMIETSDSIDAVLSAIAQHAAEFHCDRRTALQTTSYMENSCITTFFDSKLSTFFSSLRLFSLLGGQSHLYAARENGAMLLHIGSGSSSFEKAIPRDDIVSFAKSIQSTGDIETSVAWLKHAYARVSEIDEGTGAEMVSLVSTRDHPHFSP